MNQKPITIILAVLLLVLVLLAVGFFAIPVVAHNDRSAPRKLLDISHAPSAGLSIRDPLPIILSPDHALPQAEIRFKGVSYHMDIARTALSRERGLSGREALPERTGMLFVFDQVDRYGFWMKDMKISIDMIWLDEQGRIVSIVPNAHPSSYPKVFTPPVPALYVVELPAGAAEKDGIRVGDTIDLSNIVRH